MDIIINDNWRFNLDEDMLVKVLKLRNDNMIENVMKVAREASRHVKAKYIFSECAIEETGEDYVKLGGIEFKSRILANKLKDCDMVFPYFATCGLEVTEHTKTLEDVFDKYVSEKVEYLALTQIREKMRDKIKDDYNVHGISHINPGSIQGWSTVEVNKVFELLGGKPLELGISVLSSGMINPVRSVSGFMFLSEDEFHNCILCRKQDCPNRKAEFNEEEYINSL
ncbi:hypothetical protein SAMN02745751_03600 [Dethiosulfatibacter aminovorans DSM 17477]|uniref:Vitamin B12 dependent methionine synthase, activation domain n=1 Tax=Dethiosulfatibacter aminovorans DSM 17477 TaxID=1121476 RepID=A0A1M6MVH5_9FIRM|nr:hypothetical protein [Dethiosulfatibacter aminovorans]SHJ87432.1 hypothetical protein SAMN02745751_03600 [Dethiosulfatibacter aminovorans DSM 17477]